MTRLQLLKKIDELDLESDKLFIELAGYSHDQLNFKVNEKKWSAIQCLHHLILSEKNTILYCVKKLSFNPRLKKAGFKSKVKSYIVNTILASPFRFKAPDSVGSSAILPLEDSFENTKQLWKETREELRSFILDVDEKQKDREIFKHPFGMRLSLSGMISFFKYHFRRHQKQIRRVLRNQS